MNKSELEQRFLSLVDSYKQVIYKVCFMYATDDETISDLYQEVVLNLWTAFPRFRSESKPSTWVYRISMNTCISRLRHNNRQPETVSLTMSMADLFPEESEREQHTATPLGLFFVSLGVLAGASCAYFGWKKHKNTMVEIEQNLAELKNFE